jgi:hypothetical protein
MLGRQQRLRERRGACVLCFFFLFLLPFRPPLFAQSPTPRECARATTQFSRRPRKQHQNLMPPAHMPACALFKYSLFHPASPVFFSTFFFWARGVSCARPCVFSFPFLFLSVPSPAFFVCRPPTKERETNPEETQCVRGTMPGVCARERGERARGVVVCVREKLRSLLAPVSILLLAFHPVNRGVVPQHTHPPRRPP